MKTRDIDQTFGGLVREGESVDAEGRVWAPPPADGPHRGKGPRGYVRSDERIKDDVCDALTEAAHVDATGIDVEVKDGQVVLSGMVPDRETKQWAAECVADVAGVRDVVDELRVSDDERQRLGRKPRA